MIFYYNFNSAHRFMLKLGAPAAHRAHIAATLAQWQQAQALIDSKIEFYGQWMASGQRPKLVRPNPPPKA